FGRRGVRVLGLGHDDRPDKNAANLLFYGIWRNASLNWFWTEAGRLRCVRIDTVANGGLTRRLITSVVVVAWLNRLMSLPILRLCVLLLGCALISGGTGSWAARESASRADIEFVTNLDHMQMSTVPPGAGCAGDQRWD